MRAKTVFLTVFSLQLAFCVQLNAAEDDMSVRRNELQRILSVLPPEQPQRGAVSRLDPTWRAWLERTGELPPNFNAMPSLPFLPQPLVLDEGGKNIAVRTPMQWAKKRQWIEEQIKHWVTGTFPPAPKNLRDKTLSHRKDADVTIRQVQLQFGPGLKAKMTVELIIPPGLGPFPVFMTQTIHRNWALVAVRRGYIGCVYAASDGNDDTEAYADIWYPEYDFAQLMRRAWGAARVVDYLFTLPAVDKQRIGITGHSRNGKQSLMAAAFDERIKAVVTSSGGTAAEDPYRYTTERFNNETISQITMNFPYWLHPRLRFFVGNEHKLPVDQNLMMALVAPRALMLSTAVTERQGNPWGIEQAYRSVQQLYRFLGAEDKLAIRLHPGRHDTAARDIEAYVDFFDYVFGRGNIQPPQKLFYDYSFPKWVHLSGEKTDPLTYPPKGLDELLKKSDGGKVLTVADWQQRKEQIKQRIRWALGDEPAGASNAGPKDITKLPHQDAAYYGDHIARTIGRPEAKKGMGRVVVGHYNGFGDYLEGNLYYPLDEDGKSAKKNLPVVVYLHGYDYPSGCAYSQDIIDDFGERGFAVFIFDQIGFGTRIEEGTLFYQRYGHWSKMGRMVADTIAAVDMLQNLEVIDKNRIYAAGFTLGGTVGLYAAALDERIAGLICASAFTPMRLDSADKGTEGIYSYSHLHGLLPRLGFFAGQQEHIPYDFHEILACIAPRPVLVIAPAWERYAAFEDVKKCVQRAEDVYKLLKADTGLKLYSPQHYTVFKPVVWRLGLLPDVKKVMFEWAAEKFK